ncbi:MAG: enoyl-CoA hydratase/isomerase family protein [Dehalococcoidia bacterium]
MAGKQVLEEEQRGMVRLLWLNRPERKNALTPELGWALAQAVERAAHDDAVRAVGISGRGDAFCSGADLNRDSGADAASGLSPQDERLDDLSWIGRFLLAIRVDCDKPVVAGINGVAVGAGVALAMCADLRIASEAANLHPGYVRAGTSPDGGLSWTLPHLVGHETALRFLFDPRFHSASEARAMGLVGEVAPEAEFVGRYLATCDRLAALAPIGVRQTKRLVVRAQLTHDLEAHLRNEMTYVGRGLSSEDGKEAVRAIFEKRTPEFRGR